jgi:hypothetical protein
MADKFKSYPECYCGHPKYDHDGKNGRCTHVDGDKHCHCPGYEAVNWLDDYDKLNDDDDDDDEA